MQKLNMVDADTLLYQPLDKPRFVVDGLLPTADSFLRLTENRQKLAYAETLLMRVGGAALLGNGNKGRRCAVPMLEDTFFRIQDRLFRLTDEADSRLHFAVASCKLTEG